MALLTESLPATEAVRDAIQVADAGALELRNGNVRTFRLQHGILSPGWWDLHELSPDFGPATRAFFAVGEGTPDGRKIIGAARFAEVAQEAAAGRLTRRVYIDAPEPVWVVVDLLVDLQ
jgi:hypothetical protein